MNHTHHDAPRALTYDPESGLAYYVQRSSSAVARLILLHGVGGNETNLVQLAALLDPRVEIVFVRAPVAIGPQQFAWFQVRFDRQGPVIDAQQAESSREKLQVLTRVLRENDGSSPLPTVIAGFSQGGIMSASTALTSPSDVKGFAILSGRILPELDERISTSDALSTLSAFIAHGQYDDKLPVAWAERASAKLTSLGIPHQTEIYPTGHQLTPETIGDFNAWLNACLSLA
ncbi:phospholipase [Burkholderia sp. Ac-20353]|uniref:alpha/beta hydrolase n=1 Tax=Burkholderia sp. Ac-20353 TaxID=2703894 RepID=UPI00197C4EA1|nr:phospholipase [Burkholderia sp. Ac-20353]MBN3785987.1 phospholipase [Burkholderia sp. Ac-20353]